MLLRCAFREHEELFFFSPLESMDKVNRCIDLFLLNKLVDQPIFFIVVHESSGYLKIIILTTFISEESPKIKSFHSLKFCMNLAKLHIRLFGRLPSQFHIFTSWYCGTILSTHNVNVRDLRHFCLYLSVAIISTLLCSILSHF